MPILLKLYRCFCHDLKICMWFGYYPEIIFCHFFCNLNLVIFKCTIMAGDINSLNLLVLFYTIQSLYVHLYGRFSYILKNGSSLTGVTALCP